MKLKRILYCSVSLLLMLSMCASFASCNGQTEETQAPTDATEAPTEATKPTETEKPKVETMADKILKKAKLNTYDLLSGLYPVWEGNIVFNEACFVRENGDYELEPITLLYPADEIVAVRSGDLSTPYREGIDYKLEDGKLVILPSGSIPVLDYDKYNPQNPSGTTGQAAGFHWAANGYGTGGYYYHEMGQTLSGKKTCGMLEYCVSVTYKHSGESPIDEPYHQPERYKSFLDKIEAGEDITIVSMGDSITDKWSSSLGVDHAPYQPNYNRMFADYIDKAYAVNVTHHNIAVSGSSSGSGPNDGLNKINQAANYNPDLVILAYGMNDGCGVATETYVKNINTIIEGITAKCPDVCIVVVGTCMPNEKISWSKGGASILVYHKEYIDGLWEAQASWKNAGFADVGTVHLQMMEIKAYEDTTGSNSNHPNDYFHRVYTQTIIQNIFGEFHTSAWGITN